MRPFAISAALLLTALAAAGSAEAVAPCHDICHFAQGTPLLIADTGHIWVRRCDGKQEKQKCVAQHLDRTGKVLAERAVPSHHDAALLQELDGHTVVQLDPRYPAWSDLAKPYTFDRDAKPVKLRIENDTLVYTHGALPAVRRPLGCTPSAVSVFADTDGKYSAVVAIATCGSGGSEREVVAVYE